MSGIVPPLGAPSSYKDLRYEGGIEAYNKDIATSATLYCGNLSFYTTEEQVYELFSKCGEIKRIIMGLDRIKKTPCGFCFVEYYRRQDALDCVSFINGTKLDERLIRTDIDPGFKPGRQFGRGRSGGQVRDEHREDFDEGRGGWGARQRENEQREQQQRDVYNSLHVPQGSSDFYTQTYLNRLQAGAASGGSGGSAVARDLGDSSIVGRSAGGKPKRGRDDDDEQDERNGRDDEEVDEHGRRLHPRFRERSGSPIDD